MEIFFFVRINPIIQNVVFLLLLVVWGIERRMILYFIENLIWYVNNANCTDSSKKIIYFFSNVELLAIVVTDIFGSKSLWWWNNGVPYWLEKTLAIWVEKTLTILVRKHLFFNFGRNRQMEKVKSLLIRISDQRTSDQSEWTGKSFMNIPL